MMRPLLLLCFCLSSVSCSDEESDWNLWPLFTPLLGDSISEKCLAASREYITQLQQAFNTTEPLTHQQRIALEMFDSNGGFPFLMDGMLQDVARVDLCDSILAEVPDCRQTVPEYLRVLQIPKHANGPGSEAGCKAIQQAKYCHNYYQVFFDSSQQSQPFQVAVSLEQKQTIKTFQTLPVPDFFSANFSGPTVINRKPSSQIGLDPAQFINLFNLLVDRNHHAR